MSRVVYRKRLEWLKKGLIVALAAISKLIEDTLTLTDEIWQKLVGLPSDSIGFVDSVIKFLGGIVTLEEILSLGDAITKKFYGLKTDTLNLLDETYKKFITTAADGFSFADSVVRSAGRLLQETLTLADSFTGRMWGTLTDALSLADESLKNFIAQTTDGFSFTDTVGGILSSIKTETLTFADTIDKKLGKIVTETLSFADEVFKKYIRDPADSFSLSDTIAGFLTSVKTETLTLGDSIAKKLKAVRGDSLSLADTITSYFEGLVSDDFSFTDLTTRLFQRGVEETLSLTDQLFIGPLRKLISETLTLSDTFTGFMAGVKTEVLSLGDVISRLFTRPTADSFNLSDATARYFASLKEEALTLTDSISGKLSKLVSETLSFADELFKKYVRVPADSFSLIDTVAGFLATIKAETLSLGDSITKKFKKTLTDSLSLGDSIAQYLEGLVSDVFSFADSTVRSFGKGIEDTLTLTDQLFIGPLKKTITEALNLTDTFTGFMAGVKAEGLALADSLFRAFIVIIPSGVGGLSGWDNRFKIGIDSGDVDAALSGFPVLIDISSTFGINGDDITAIFDEVGANRKKIAVTKGDGVTQCYVEIERWDAGAEKAWLWVKIPDVDPDVDDELYLYYDNTQPDNTTYVGDTGSTPGKNVWDEYFRLVLHMGDDPDTSHVKDSTSYNNHGTKKASNEPIQIDGKIGKAQDFDGFDDFISLDAHIANFASLTEGTIECWHKNNAWPQGANILVSAADKSDNFSDLYHFTIPSDFHYQSREASAGLLYMNAIMTPTAGVWWYYVMAVDAAGGKLYVDAVDVTHISQGFDEFFDDINDLDSLRIGNRVDLEVNKYHADAIIDEVRISSIKRTPAWIKASRESGKDHLLYLMSDPGAVEGFSFTDTIVGYFKQTLTEGLTLADVLATRLYRKLIEETLSLADTLTRAFTPSASDSFSFGDSIAGYLTSIKAETLNLVDTFTGVMGKVKSETLTLADSITRLFPQSVSDSFNFADTVNTLLSSIKAETLSLGDSIISRKFREILAEGLNLADEIFVKFSDLLKYASDSFSFTDNIYCERSCCQVCEGCETCVSCYSCDNCQKCDTSCYDCDSCYDCYNCEACQSCQASCYTCDTDDPCIICEGCYRCNTSCYTCYSCDASCYTCESCNAACYNCVNCEICVVQM